MKIYKITLSSQYMERVEFYCKDWPGMQHAVGALVPHEYQHSSAAVAEACMDRMAVLNYQSCSHTRHTGNDKFYCEIETINVY